MSDQDQAQEHVDWQNLRLSLDRLERTVRDLPDKIERTYVRADVYARDQVAQDKEIAEHASWLLWAQRLVISAVILGLLGLLIQSNGGLK